MSRPLLSLHAHNEAQRVPELLARLEAGEMIALVSDAGTPLLSDPGFELVRDAARAGYRCARDPGTFGDHRGARGRGAARRAAFASKASCRRATRERRARLAQLADETRTLVFFEAPHRIAADARGSRAEFGGDRAPSWRAS